MYAIRSYYASQFNLAQRYEAGKDVDRDVNKAADWYRKAAMQGHQKAQTNLGNLYRIGRGVDKDYDEAMQWYRKAAEQGDTKAMINIALMYVITSYSIHYTKLYDGYAY